MKGELEAGDPELGAIDCFGYLDCGGRAIGSNTLCSVDIIGWIFEVNDTAITFYS